MSALYMIVGTLVALGVLVTFHEFGHFWVARRCGAGMIVRAPSLSSQPFLWVAT